MPGRVYDELLDLALDQYGYVSSQDARAVGVDPRRLVEMERRGTLRRVAHGLYRFPSVPVSALDQLMEATLWPRGRGVISHESALDLHDLCDVSPGKVHLTIPVSYRLWRAPPRAFVVHRRHLGAADVIRHEGIPVVTPLRAIRDGIEEHLGDHLLDQAIDTARGRGLIMPGELEELAAERAGGARPCRRAGSSRRATRGRSAVGSTDTPRAEGIATGRMQRWVSYMILVAALDRVRDLEGEPLFLVKGGVAMELRLKLDARATKDFDATFREGADQMLSRLDEALREPYGGFSLTRSVVEDVGPTRAKRLNVSLAYRGRSWSTVKLELSPGEGETAVDVERVPAVDLAQFGLEGPETVSCLSVRYQIAQKLHAGTARRTDGKDNDRFRDLIDLILLRGLIDRDDLPGVREACTHVFAVRGQQSWPPTVEVPTSWAAPYARLAEELEFAIRDVKRAADRVSEIIGDIDGAGGS